MIPHIPLHLLSPARPRREAQIKSTQQRRSHSSDFHQRQIPAHAAEPALEEGGESSLVAHEFRSRVPALGDEFQRAGETGREAVQAVDGEAEDGGAGDGGGGYGYAFGRGFAEAGGGDGRVQAEGFVDGAVEAGEGLQGSGVWVRV